MQETLRDLHCKIKEHCKGLVIKQLEVTAGFEEEFDEAWSTLNGKLECS
jgi:hypothetical protein